MTRNLLFGIALVGLLVMSSCGKDKPPESTTGGVQVTFSGETFSVKGLPFAPANEGDPVFVDGWTLHFDEVLIAVGNVRLTDGIAPPTAVDPRPLKATVAQKVGPYIVDMHKPNGLVGADGVAPAQEIFTWAKRDDGKALSTTSKYAFSYDVVPATASATQINLSADQAADVALMVSKGWSKLYRGTAVYVGTGHVADPVADAKFAAFPTTLHFIAGLNDANQVLDCVNPSNGSAGGQDSGADLSRRGIQVKPSGNTVAQITLHVDHLFWDKLTIEGTPLRFDPVAAWATAANSNAATPLDLSSLDKPLSTTFADGTPLPDRAPYQNVPGGYTSDQSNPAQVVLETSGVSTVKNLADFLAFSNQSEMHLNADGLCYMVGQYPRDPYFSPGLPK